MGDIVTNKIFKWHLYISSNDKESIIMNTRSLINFVKYNKLIYNIYYYLGSFFLRLLGIFIHQKTNRIVFSSFGGRKYDDSPRCIYEAMLNDSRFQDYELIWAFGNPEQFDIPAAKKVKCDTLEYYKTLLSASVWVTNSGMERGLSFKPKRIFNLNTWHGSAIKRMGTDIGKDNASFVSNVKDTHDDIMLAQGKYDIDIFSRVFRIPKENFRITGLPRNDELVNCNTIENRKRIRKLLGIDEEKTVILYAPTFREYDKDAGMNCKFNLPINIDKWQHQLGGNFILLIRAHYEIVKLMDFQDNDFIKNVSSYPKLNELMIASDLLISDYSSIFFDYSIMDKPMLCFAYDYEKYSSHRGMYFDIRKELEGNHENEDQLITSILSLDFCKAISITRRFRNQFLEEFGNASQKSVDIIHNYLSKKPY